MYISLCYKNYIIIVKRKNVILNRLFFKIIIILFIPLFNTMSLGMSLGYFFKSDIFLWRILPLLSLTDYKNVRLAYKECAQDTLKKLYQEYCTDKHRSITSVSFDCVHKNKQDEVRWFFKNKLDRKLYFTNGCSDHQCDVFVTPYMVAEYDNNTKMMALINEYNVLSKNDALCEFVTQPINVNLFITACIGDIASFEKEYCKEYAIDQEKNVRNIFPVIWAAMKNYDVGFIENLLRHDEYKLFINQHSNILLAGIIFGKLYEEYVLVGKPGRLFESNLMKDYIVTRIHIEGVKALIQSECFNLKMKKDACPSFCSMSVMDHFYYNFQYSCFNEIENILFAEIMKDDDNDDFCFLI